MNMKTQLVLAIAILLSLGTAIAATLIDAEVPAYSAAEIAPKALAMMQADTQPSYTGTLVRPL